MPTGKQPSNPSLKTAMKTKAANVQFPSDLGLLERKCSSSVRRVRADWSADRFQKPSSCPPARANPPSFAPHD